MTGTVTPSPSARPRDLAGLGWRLATSVLRREEGAGAILQAWAQATARRLESEAFLVGLGRRRLLFVMDRGLSEHVLAQSPADGDLIEGDLKREAMGFLAPEALTISHGEAWTRRRRFNERVLEAVHDPADAQAFLEHVRAAFSGPVASASDIRAAMGAAMRGIVFGDRDVPEGLADDARALFGVVQSPLKRKLLGFRYRRRRARFYDALRLAWGDGDAEAPSLLTRARAFLGASGGLEDEEAIQQVPHWMFTFTGSGTDLLVRTLALIGSRPDVYARVAAEVGASGADAEVAAVDGLVYTEACLLEAGRLFPPVARTFHCAAREHVHDGVLIPEGTEIVHVFKVLQRGRDAAEERFDPERRLIGAETPGTDSPAPYSNLFLHGPRACPGRDLILFVCKAAIAELVRTGVARFSAPALAADPLPLTFPDGDVRVNPAPGISQPPTPDREARP